MGVQPMHTSDEIVETLPAHLRPQAGRAIAADLAAVELSSERHTARQRRRSGDEIRAERRLTAKAIDLAKSEILSDAADHLFFPVSAVHSFADLHDYVDANEYGASYELSHDAVNEMQDALDRWLKAGGLRAMAIAETGR